MNELVFIQNDEILVCSKEIANNFSKRHDHVLRDIENIEKDVPNFGEMFHKGETEDSYGRSQPCYFMNRDGFTLLAMGFTGKQALYWKIKYINAFNQMEKKLKTATPQLTGEELMAKALIEAKSIMERQNKEITEMKPKALFADTVSASDNSILVGQEAKLISQRGFKVGQNRFFAWLREHGYLCSKGENYNMPTQKSREMNLIEIKIRTVANPDGSVRETKTPVITGKGQVYFVNKYIEKSNAES